MKRTSRSRQDTGSKTRPPERIRSERPRFTTSAPVIADYFCGAGGVTAGALRAGASVACGIDCDPRVKDSYVRNYRNSDRRRVKFIASRIEDLDPEVVRCELAKFPGRPTVLVGCPPCQPFTNLRTTKAKPAASLGALSSFLDHVEHIAPDFVMIENVPGIRAARKGQAWKSCVARLAGLGYSVRAETVNAARFGVPQKRIRTLLMAVKKTLGSSPPWPQETHSPGNYRTVRDALKMARLRKLEAGEACPVDRLHSAAKLSPLNLRRIQAIRKPGGSRTSWPEDLWLDCYREHTGHTDVYGRMAWDRPAPTLTTRFVSLSNGRFGHPSQDRAITPREGALLQTFSPRHQFRHPKRDVNVAQIGNAVPPDLMAACVRAIRTYPELNLRT